MKIQYTLLQKQIHPTLTVLFKETNKDHPMVISDGKGFSIIIGSWIEGNYSLESNGIKLASDSFKPLKTIGDLNDVWKSLIGRELTCITRYTETVVLGETYPTKRNGNMKVIEIISTKESKVEFENGYTRISQNCNILRGNVKNPYYPSVYNIGYLGEGVYSSARTPDIYDRWRHMIQRCYEEKSRHRSRSYANTIVCNEWICLQNFGTWHDSVWKSYMIGWELDKDFISEEVKEYSPETCCFVPQIINTLFINSGKKYTKMPIGVIKQSNKYYAKLSKGEDDFKSEPQDTPDKAFQIYKCEKEKYAKEIAEEYKELIDVRVYNRLINFRAIPYPENIEYKLLSSTTTI